MKTKLFLMAGLIGSVVHFLVGWLVYGVLLLKTMQAHTNQSLFKKQNDMVFWSLFVGSICMGLLLTFLLKKSRINSSKEGFKLSAIIGLLSTGYMSFSSFGTSNVYNDLQAVFMDTFAGGFVTGLTGFFIALYFSKSHSS